jgi:hypothetical protein
MIQHRFYYYLKELLCPVKKKEQGTRNKLFARKIHEITNIYLTVSALPKGEKRISILLRLAS